MSYLSTFDVPSLPRLNERRRMRMVRGTRARSEERVSYLSRWSRENTPVDSDIRFSHTVNRSFTPVRDLSHNNSVHYQNVERNYRWRSESPIRALSGVGATSTPYHTNVNYYREQQPLRKWDVFQVRTWSYPIWKYIQGRDTTTRRSYSNPRPYGLYTHYTPPTMTAELRTPTVRRGYSGYGYMAGEHSFDISSRPRSLDSYQFWRSRLSSGSNWYWNYYGHCGLRHFASYKPRTYLNRVRTYWN